MNNQESWRRGCFYRAHLEVSKLLGTLIIFTVLILVQIVYFHNQGPTRGRVITRVRLHALTYKSVHNVKQFHVCIDQIISYS